MKKEVLNLDDYVWVHNNYSYKCFFYGKHLVFISYVDIRDLLNNCLDTRRIEYLDVDKGYSRPSWPSLNKFVRDNPIVKFQGLEYSTKSQGRYGARLIEVELI